MIKTARDAGSPLQLIETIIDVNMTRRKAMLMKIITACGGSVQARRIAVWGLTFKPDTDDIRESPALPIIAGLIDAGDNVCAFDPEGMVNARDLETGAEFAPNQYDAAAGADALVLVTEWQSFRSPDFVRLGSLMKKRIVVDLRNALSPMEAQRHGFIYVGIGLGDS